MYGSQNSCPNCPLILVWSKIVLFEEEQKDQRLCVVLQHNKLQQKPG